MALFRHGVASGDPDRNRVVIWTRVSVEDARPVELDWVVARDPGRESVVAKGRTTATSATDFTTQVDVGSLRPNTHYWYSFESGGEQSPIGRTKTLPAGTVDHLRFAVVSCAKFNSGFFNGYARIAERDDLDFVLHLGDYIYEAAQNPPAGQTPGADIGRPFDPLNECVTLADYRRRYAQYRADPDTLAMHHAHPLLATLDDHEFADGAWRGGADEHKPERDGPWSARREAAFQARREWTRSRRDQPVAGHEMFDPARSQLGTEQRAWLFDGLKASSSRWRLLANSSVMSQTWAPGMRPELRPDLRALKLISADGSPDPDQWDGYPIERSMLLDHFAGRDVVILSGDVHVGMAIELKHDAQSADDPIAAEFVTTSLTSQNLDDKMGWGYRTGSVEVERELMELLPSIRWCDLDSHGYMVVDVTPNRVQVEHWFVDGILARSPDQRLAARWEVRPGSSSISRVD